MIQLINKDHNIGFKYLSSLKNLKKLSHSTLQRGGIIITIKPKARGSDTPTISVPSNACLADGTYTDNNIPNTIDVMISKGNSLSNKDNPCTACRRLFDNLILTFFLSLR